MQQEDPLEAEAEPLEKGVVGVEAEPLEELGKVGSQLGPSSPAGNSTLGGQSKLVIDEVRKVLNSCAVLGFCTVPQRVPILGTGSL